MGDHDGPKYAVDEKNLRVWIRAVMPVQWTHDLGLWTKDGLKEDLKKVKWCIRLSHIDALGLGRFNLPTGRLLAA